MQQTPPTSPGLPAPVGRYIAKEATGELARCGTNDAVVVDERREHRGRAVIAAWNAASKAPYSFTIKPHSSTIDGEVVTVSAMATGTFPGSPVELRFGFTIKTGLMARLEIAP